LDILLAFKMKIIFCFFLIFGLVSPITVAAQNQESRVALVIGNSSYKNSPLKNPINDANDVSAKLRNLGFVVVERNNLVVKNIGGTLRDFRSKLKPGSIAMVFYAGHGVQIKGENYFPAVDADIQGEEDVPQQSLAVRQIMDILSDAKTRLNLIFLDACRDNPYARSFRSASRGLSRESAPSGTLISFATRPGSVASDGIGRNGLYTASLLDAMENKNQPIEQILKQVTAKVKATSKGQQEPWMEGSIEGDFCFGNCNHPNQSIINDDHIFWGSIKDSRDINDYLAYIKKFPSGFFSDIAKNRINLLGSLKERLNFPSDVGIEPIQKKPPLKNNDVTYLVGAAQMEDASRKLTTQYFSTWSINDGVSEEFLDRYLSDRVNFYGGDAKKSEIMSQKIKFMKRWPTRKYKEQTSSTLVNCNNERKTCSVKGLVDWSVASIPRNAKSSGVSEFELGFDYSSGDVRITYENGRTLERSN
jgi:hypothetical protein